MKSLIFTFFLFVVSYSFASNTVVKSPLKTVPAKKAVIKKEKKAITFNLSLNNIKSIKKI